ncbi:heme-binding protein [Polaromonas sp. YR568]|uniref:GlcG/HbpS family heme-binding protein n=1 Tax=Polaromonas sp. YR568 TaxID=1855301 RepID=UPI0031383E77
MRTSRRSTLCLALLLSLSGGVLQAQQATFQAASLTPDAALKAARAALETCRKNGHQAAVSVNDRAGNSLVMLRDRFAGPHTVETAINKAYTAVSFKLDTTSFARSTQAGEPASGIRHLPRVVAIGGGIPIESAGSIVGAIGVSGAPGGDADDVCAKAGIAAIRDDLEF